MTKPQQIDKAQEANPTWRDIEYRSLVDPVLHAAVTRVNRGDLTRQEALIAAALALSQIRQELMDAEVERRIHEHRRTQEDRQP